MLMNLNRKLNKPFLSYLIFFTENKRFQGYEVYDYLKMLIVIYTILPTQHFINRKHCLIIISFRLNIRYLHMFYIYIGTIILNLIT